MTTKQRIKIRRQLRAERAEWAEKLAAANRDNDISFAEHCRGQISMIDRELEELD